MFFILFNEKEGNVGVAAVYFMKSNIREAKVMKVIIRRLVQNNSTHRQSGAAGR